MRVKNLRFLGHSDDEAFDKVELGMTSLKKECLLSGIARIRGGEALARKFWPYFHQVLIPKISQFLL